MRFWSIAMVCLVAGSAGAWAKPHAPFEMAKVISQNISSYNGGAAVMPIGTALIGVPITRRSNVVVIETAGRRITLIEAANDRNGLVLEVNGTAQFYQDG